MRFLICSMLVFSSFTALPAEDVIRFNQDVRPILAEHCWQCHGFDEHARKAELRLDDRANALQPAASGAVAIVPGDISGSELVTRITSSDDQLRMPPADFPKPLSAAQIRTLQTWIAQGAHFEQHWAFVSPRRTEIVPTDDERNPIDVIVANTLRQHGLTFAPEASRETLLRRVSFDLTGLPPSEEDLERYARGEESYAQAVERLLGSPHYGEHLAAAWLDAARFADTNGYFSDKPRQMWLWRNWVIDAFNANMPFNQFTIEQLAGDLLPEASVSQRIATGFNRNHMANNETGIIDEEFRVQYVADRVDTTLTTWMGLTVACAQCHDHKYDPISQREYYQLFAFFNNVPETGLITSDNPPPVLTVTSPDQQHELARLTEASATATRGFDAARENTLRELAEWESAANETLPRAPQEGVLFQESFDGRLNSHGQAQGTSLKFQTGVRGQAGKFDGTQHITAHVPEFRLDKPWSVGLWLSPDGSLSGPFSMIEPEGDRRGLEVLWQKGRFTVNLVSQWDSHAIEITTVDPVIAGQWHQLVVCYDGTNTAQSLDIFVDGKSAAVQVHRDSLTGPVTTTSPLLIGRRDAGLGYYGMIDELRILDRSLTHREVSDWYDADRIRGILQTGAADRSSRDSEVLLDYFIAKHSDLTVQELRRLQLEAQLAEQNHRRSIPTTLVMEELPQARTTHVLVRGEYDQPSDVVQPGVPKALSPWPADAPLNRIGFAQWLVSSENPLTARVAVNRLWIQCFGEGLVRTPNDFGTQGEAPTHAELLDWLAVTFRESGWDTRSMLRLIVTSRTYRQNSAIRTNDVSAADTANRLLARGPAFRLSAEMLRDQALAVSGLLKPQIGGPSVKPWQPPGLWEEVSYNAEDSYVEDLGDGLWRRSLYTYLKRQSPPPSMLIFDGPTREKCTVQRTRTNTPLQALNLLNDPIYLEASRRIAIQSLRQTAEDETRLRSIFRRIVSRYPTHEESILLNGLLQRQRSHFRQSDDEAKSVMNAVVSETEPSEIAESAAWTIVAHTILNLDEAVNRR
jgi:hypothetical protein